MQLATEHVLLVLHTPEAQSLPLVQLPPVPQAGHTPPPQSTLVSAAFWTPSLHVAEHTPPTQDPLSQLSAPVHAFPTAHSGQEAPNDTTPPSQCAAVTPQNPKGLQHSPTGHAASVGVFHPHSKLGPTARGLMAESPQSTSDSSPLARPSPHRGDEHTVSRQTPESQSPAMLHVAPPPQPEQLPPQSTPVSTPFWTPSMQLAAEHVLLVLHTPEAQSLPLVQLPPVPHRPQTPPPQSTPVSAPFFTPSLQLAAAQVPDVHAPVAQLAPVVHVLPVAHAGHCAPGEGEMSTQCSAAVPQ